MTGLPEGIRTLQAAIERNRAEESELLRQINTAAAHLHELWATRPDYDPLALASRHDHAVALQTELDELYARRRQLLAERAVLKALRYGRSGAPGPVSAFSEGVTGTSDRAS